MSKKSRKMKWRGVALNHSNIDEYMKDLQEDTAGQYITQGVSFNKDDNFQMNLLKNSILAHGSFSGFVKNLLFAYFEKNGSIDESVWQPNPIDENMVSEEAVAKQLPPSPIPVATNPPQPSDIKKEDEENQKENEDENNIKEEDSVGENLEGENKGEITSEQTEKPKDDKSPDQDKEKDKQEEAPKPTTRPTRPKKKNNKTNPVLNDFITPHEED